MTREDAQGLMMAAIDGEIDAAGREQLQAYLEMDAEAREEFEQMRELAARASLLKFAPPPPEAWDTYVAELRPRLERPVGWGLAIAGVLGLVGACALLFLRTPAIPVGFKLLAGAAAAGFGVLFLSVWREKRYVNQRERYGRVRR